MSEYLPPPRADALPDLARDPGWVREVPSGTALARIFTAGGRYPVAWHEFRTYGPVDARFDPHPEPPAEYADSGVLYAALELPGAARESASPLAACLLEVFQSTRIVRRSDGTPTLAIFETSRTLRLLDLSDSDWVAVAGGNAAISSGDRMASRAWARAIRTRYPGLDGVVSASSVVPSARVVALWSPAEDAMPRHPIAQLRLDRDELTGVIDRIAARYGYVVV